MGRREGRLLAAPALVADSVETVRHPSRCTPRNIRIPPARRVPNAGEANLYAMLSPAERETAPFRSRLGHVGYAAAVPGCPTPWGSGERTRCRWVSRSCWPGRRDWCSLVDGRLGSNPAQRIVGGRPESPGNHSSSNIGEESVRDHPTPSPRSEVATDVTPAPPGAGSRAWAFGSVSPRVPECPDARRRLVSAGRIHRAPTRART